MLEAVLINGTDGCVLGETFAELDVGIAGGANRGELPLAGAGAQSLGCTAGEPAILHF